MQRRDLIAGLAATSLAGTKVRSQERSKEPIRIGILGDMAGPTSDYAGKGAIEAVRLATEEFGNSVGGRPVEVLVADHQNKADIAVGKARELYDTAGVGMLINLSSSSAALAVQEIAKEKRKVAIVTAAGSNRLTNETCNPDTLHWTFNSDSLTSGIVAPLLADGQKTWFLIVADFAFGQALEQSVKGLLDAGGGKIIGSVRYPFIAPDFSSYTLQAASSGAQVIGLANSTADTVNSIKSLSEFGIIGGGKQRVVAFTVLITDIHAVGLATAQGLQFAEALYWDRDDRTREWSRRFGKRAGRMPNMVNAGDYSATRHYLAAIRDEGTDDADKVVARMKATPVDDMAFHGTRIRSDGLHVHEMLVLEVKKPAESRAPWDYYHIRGVVPSDIAYPPESASRCRLRAAAL